MKCIIIICIIFTTVLFACDPGNKAIFNTESVKIRGTFNDTSPSIQLGDTLRIQVYLPDSVQSSTAKIPVQSVQYAQFYMRVYKVDTINNKGIVITYPKYWTSLGGISPTNVFDFVFNNGNRPFGVIFNFKPSEKGLYYLEVASQPGILKINNNYEARLFVNFDVADKHLALVSPYFGGQAWLDAANNNDALGFGVYAFRVN